MQLRPLIPALLGFAFLASPALAQSDSDSASLRNIDPAPAPVEEQPAQRAVEPVAAALADQKQVERRQAGRGRRDEIAGAAHVRALIAKRAAEHGVPAALADAVARIESRYNPRAAHAGNYGLMQIKLQTARGEGYTGSAQGLLDADVNANFGVKHLARAWRMANGDTCGTIMRYQGGLRTTRMSAHASAYCGKVKTLMQQASLEPAG